MRLLERLRAGDEEAFMELVNQYQASMIRIAMLYVADTYIAEEVVQETWLGVLHGLDRFEGRSSLKTWIYRILTNRAKTRGQREGRYVPLSSVWDSEYEADEPLVAPQRFNPPENVRWAGHWIERPSGWDDVPEDVLLSQEVGAEIQRAIDALPPHQREVIVLRDVEELSSSEVRNIMGISDTNQRVLLHRARTKVQRTLERYFKDKVND
jgi:RNA polymerase sigma-70 factor, ECF subfamily